MIVFEIHSSGISCSELSSRNVNPWLAVTLRLPCPFGCHPSRSLVAVGIGYSESRKGLNIMRQRKRIQVVLWLAPLLITCGRADDLADRAAIDSVISALNQVPQPARLFMDDCSCELGRLPDFTPQSFRILGPSTDLPSSPRANRPSVTISHEPWGEAQINLPGSDYTVPPMELLNPRISIRVVRFIASDVATVDADWTYQDPTRAQTLPLLFVMMKREGIWKIASARLLASSNTRGKK